MNVAARTAAIIGGSGLAAGALGTAMGAATAGPTSDNHVKTIAVGTGAGAVAGLATAFPVTSATLRPALNTAGLGAAILGTFAAGAALGDALFD